MAYYKNVETYVKKKLQPNGELRIKLPAITPGSIIIKITYPIVPKVQSLGQPGVEPHPSTSYVPPIIGGTGGTGEPEEPLPQMPVKNITSKLKVGGYLLGKAVNYISVINKFKSDKVELIITNKDATKKILNISVSYTSDRLILKKEVPLSFFRQAFDSMWNEVQPIKELKIDKNIFSIWWDKNLKEAFPLPVVEKDFGKIDISIDTEGWHGPVWTPDVIPGHQYLTIRDFKSTKINFSVGTGKLPMPEWSHNTAPIVPVFTLWIEFETEGTEFDIRPATPDVNLKKITLEVNLYFTTNHTGSLIYEPVAKLKVGIDDAWYLPEGTIENKISDVVEGMINNVLEEHASKVSKKISTWLLGGSFHVHKITAKNGIMTIHYLEPETKKVNPGPLPHSLPGPVRRQGKLSKIKHFVVLMMENRSFDQMLGYLSLDSYKAKHPGRPHVAVNGLKESQFGEWANPYNEKMYPPYRLEDPHILQSPNHGYLDVKDQKNGNMKGFVTDFANIPDNPEKPKRIMGYYDDDSLKVYGQLAKEFLVCDRWYCSIPGGTWPNRFITLTGKLDTKKGSPDYTNPSLSEFIPVNTKTLFDHLTEKKVSWKYFEHGYCFLRLFSKYTYDMENIVDAKDKKNGFFALAKKGKLPSVTFLDPDFIEYPPGNDDHAPAHPYCGQKLVGDVVNSLKASKAWKDTMLIITYDEHGGFYDHVNPDVAESPAPMISGTLDEYGIRVPTIIVSPWVKKGGFSNELFDHTSIAATILRRFWLGPPDMGPRVNSANDLRNVIEDERRDNIPDVKIPKYPPCKHFKLSTPKTSKKVEGEKTEDDFHELLLLASMFGRAPK